MAAAGSCDGTATAGDAGKWLEVMRSVVRRCILAAGFLAVLWCAALVGVVLAIAANSLSERVGVARGRADTEGCEVTRWIRPYPDWLERWSLPPDDPVGIVRRMLEHRCRLDSTDVLGVRWYACDIATRPSYCPADGHHPSAINTL